MIDLHWRRIRSDDDAPVSRSDLSKATMKRTVDWIAMSLGWYYVLTMTLVTGFVLWVAMRFAAGVGIDMLFYSVTGPVAQYMYPPSGEGSTAKAMQGHAVVDPRRALSAAGQACEE